MKTKLQKEVFAAAAAEPKQTKSHKVNGSTLQNAVLMESATRVKSEYAKAFDKAEERAKQLTEEKVFSLWSSYLQIALCEERADLEKRGFEREAQKLGRVIEEGFNLTEGFRIRYSDTENGIISAPARNLHEMRNAAAQSMLCVLQQEREQRAAEKQQKEAEKKAAFIEAGLTAEMYAVLVEKGLIK